MIFTRCYTLLHLSEQCGAIQDAFLGCKVYFCRHEKHACACGVKKKPVTALIIDAVLFKPVVLGGFQGLLNTRDKALTEITRWKALFFPTWEQVRYRSTSSCKHVPYIYKTLTRARIHNRQFHYSQSG